ncbi:MAG: S1C family serine protease [Myxococcales bacterium]|jgi:serine protease Do
MARAWVFVALALCVSLEAGPGPYPVPISVAAPLRTERAAATAPRATLAPLVEAVRPTVVRVTTRERVGRLRRFFNGIFGEGPFGMFADVETGLGSGVIIAPDGLVLTNNHVIEGADIVIVTTADGRDYEADVVGGDAETDVALLRLRGATKDLPKAQLGSSSDLRVGDFVVAIGNPFGLEMTVTSGIISAKARALGESAFDSYLQTDAAINPGNSGGPLFDLDGRVVGINTAIVDQADGIGFAVPSDLIRSLLPPLRDNGRVVRGFLGVTLRDLSFEDLDGFAGAVEQGAFIESVRREGPAAQAGLRAGDVVVGVDGKAIADASALTQQVAGLPPGSRVSIVYVREGATHEVEVVLGTRPSDE